MIMCPLLYEKDFSILFEFLMVKQNQAMTKVDGLFL